MICRLMKPIMFKLRLKASGCADISAPTDILYGLLWIDENRVVQVPYMLPYIGEWGEILTPYEPIEETNDYPTKISVLWLSLIENKAYEYEGDLNIVHLNKICEDIVSISNDDELYFIIGTAPFGKLSLWIGNRFKRVLVDVFEVEEVSIDLHVFKPFMPDGLNISDYCANILRQNNIDKSDLDLYKLNKRWRSKQKQYNLRFVVVFETYNGNNDWDDSKYKDKKIEYVIATKNIDGTLDKTYDNSLLNFHNSGCPYKINVSFTIDKREYLKSINLMQTQIIEIFERFYGAHPETKADFIIRIDVENKKYELALYRQGLKEPVVIPESAYQLIVFKNKFEDYRSENYNQPRGAWIW